MSLLKTKRQCFGNTLNLLQVLISGLKKGLQGIMHQSSGGMVTTPNRREILKKKGYGE